MNLPIVSIISFSSPRFLSLVSFFGETGLSESFLLPFFPPFPGDCDTTRVGVPILEASLSSLFLDPIALNCWKVKQKIQDREKITKPL